MRLLATSAIVALLLPPVPARAQEESPAELAGDLGPGTTSLASPVEGTNTSADERAAVRDRVSLCGDDAFAHVTGSQGPCSGRVTRSDRDRVEIEAAPLTRLSRDQSVAFYVYGPEGERRVATGVVTQVPGESATVLIGLGERVPVGARAVQVDAVDHSLWVVPRIADRFVMRASLDGLIGFDGGGGAMLTADAAWHLEAPVVLRAGLAPLALGGRGDTGIFAGLGYASVGLDLDWMELSLGVAGTSVNRRARGQATGAFAPVLGARVGWSEGFSVEGQLFLTIDDIGLRLGVGRLRLTFPLTPGHRLVFRADLGRHGVVRVDGGVIVFLDGRGDRGSLALGFFIGGGELSYQSVCPFGVCGRTSVLAPTLGIELDWWP